MQHSMQNCRYCSITRYMYQALRRTTKSTIQYRIKYSSCNVVVRRSYERRTYAQHNGGCVCVLCAEWRSWKFILAVSALSPTVAVRRNIIDLWGILCTSIGKSTQVCVRLWIDCLQGPPAHFSFEASFATCTTCSDTCYCCFLLSSPNHLLFSPRPIRLGSRQQRRCVPLWALLLAVRRTHWLRLHSRSPVRPLPSRSATTARPMPVRATCRLFPCKFER